MVVPDFSAQLEALKANPYHQAEDGSIYFRNIPAVDLGYFPLRQLVEKVEEIGFPTFPKLVIAKNLDIKFFRSQALLPEDLKDPVAQVQEALAALIGKTSGQLSFNDGIIKNYADTSAYEGVAHVEGQFRRIFASAAYPYNFEFVDSELELPANSYQELMDKEGLSLMFSVDPKEWQAAKAEHLYAFSEAGSIHRMPENLAARLAGASRVLTQLEFSPVLH